MNFKSLLLVTCLCITACTGKNGESETGKKINQDFPQSYALSSFSNMRANSETTGDEMPYQETYTFFKDGGFEKIRNEEGRITKASGYFKISLVDPEEQHFILDFITGLELAESCLGESTEQLIITSQNQIRGTANACDHPSKTYEKID